MFELANLDQITHLIKGFMNQKEKEEINDPKSSMGSGIIGSYNHYRLYSHVKISGCIEN